MANFIKYGVVAAASFAAGVGAKVLYDNKKPSSKDADEDFISPSDEFFDDDEEDFFHDTDEAIAAAEDKFEAEQAEQASNKEEETSSSECESPEE